MKGKKTGGRQKNTPNRNTKLLKDMVVGALARVGGEDYMVEQAKTNPNAFLALVRSLLPLQVKDGGEDQRVPTRTVVELHPGQAPPKLLP